VAAAIARRCNALPLRSNSRPDRRLLPDASFSPVRRVTYRSKPRASNSAPIWTSFMHRHRANGTIEPEEAIRRAGGILKDQLSVFVDLQGER